MDDHLAPSRNDHITRAARIYIHPPEIPPNKSKMLLLQEMRDFSLSLFGYELRNEQQTVVYNLLTKKPLLLAEKTGVGKSTVAYPSGVLFGGVVLYIIPLLSLGVQTFVKVVQMEGKSSCGSIKSINLDDARTPEERASALAQISYFEGVTDTKRDVLFVFGSPQYIIHCSGLLLTKGPSLIIVVECYYISVFRVGFRTEFLQLGSVFFKPYIVYNSLSPFLAIPATNTERTLLHMSRLFNISLPLSVH
mmetsp:Transcript_27541/g.55111  ORF Transcript_27541/g.55111 Transcript_27541/m.55111 type:complete len:249 (+) Transcript_27541:747-1493(+)